MTLRAILGKPGDIDVVAINDVVPLDQLEYLLLTDTVHLCPDNKIESGPGWLRIDGKELAVYGEPDPAQLPWDNLGVDVVVESSGAFRHRDGMVKHLEAGASKVVLTAPAKGGGADVTVCMGVNHDMYEPECHHLISNASCTTNCLAPVVRAIDEAFGLRWGLMSTIHAVTGSQALLDAANKKKRRGRSAAWNIVPTTTGAAAATATVLPHLDGKIDGMAFRVPVPDGSIVDLVFETDEPITAQSLHDTFSEAADDPTYLGVLGISEHEYVSSDIIGCELSALVDTASTLVLDNHHAKVAAWYDNEWGYACRVRDLVRLVGEHLDR
jgi:glyceraldehyde 3-phosphate dehydrogenase